MSSSRTPTILSLALAAVMLLALGLASHSGPPPSPSDRLVELLARSESRFRAEDFAQACATVARVSAQLRTHAPGHDDLDIAARAQLLAGRCELEHGRAEQGAAALLRARELAREADNPTLAAQVELGTAEVAWARADYGRVEEYVASALDSARDAGDEGLEAQALELLARAHFKRGRYDEADSLFFESLELCDSAGDHACAARALSGLASSALDRRDFARAEEHFALATQRWRDAREPFGESEALALTAALHLFQGTGEEAYAQARAALEVAVRSVEPAAEARARQVLGHAERARGRSAEGLLQLARAAELRRQTGSWREEAWARAGRAEALEPTDPLEARGELERSLELWRLVDDRRALAWHQLEAARLDIALGRSAVATEELASAVALANDIELPYRSEILREQSRLLRMEGKLRKSLDSARRAVEAARESANDEMLWRALIDLAAIAADAGRSDEARDATREVLGLLERLRVASLPNDEAKIAGLERMQQAYETAISVLFELGQGEEALLIAEHARARALLERRGAAPAATLSEATITARREGVAILELFSGRDRLYLWAVSRSGAIAARAVEVGRDSLAERIRVASTTSDDPHAAATAWRELALLVLQPVAGVLEPADAPLAIAAHGPLLRLSFAALADSSGRPLIEGRPLFAIPSIGFLGAERARLPGAGRVVLLADPEPPQVPGRDSPLPRLAGARREARAIAALFPPERVDLLEGAAASEERLVSLAPSAQILHLAAHGLPNDEEPLGSRLALAASAGADGLWTAREALELRLRAELVVLSACSGGGGAIFGEGALGFGHALLGAGAQSVLASLWPVPDEVAAYQVERFFRELVRGSNRSAALRVAMLDTRDALATGRFSTPGGEALEAEPRFWAGFVLLGRQL